MLSSPFQSNHPWNVHCTHSSFVMGEDYPFWSSPTSRLFVILYRWECDGNLYYKSKIQPSTQQWTIITIPQRACMEIQLQKYLSAELLCFTKWRLSTFPADRFSYLIPKSRWRVIHETLDWYFNKNISAWVTFMSTSLLQVYNYWYKFS